MGDLNGDGNLDVAHGTTYHTNSAAVRLGLGDGTFAPAAAYKSGDDTYAVTLADINHDAKLDVAAANYGDSSVSVLLGTGDGTLGPRTRYRMDLPTGFTMLGFVDAVVVADFDRDGHADVATPGWGNASVRRGRGDDIAPSAPDRSRRRQGRDGRGSRCRLQPRRLARPRPY